MVSVDQIEAHALAGGRVQQCVSALIAARQHGIDTRWEEVGRWDLDGLDPLELIHDAANPPEPPADA